MRTNVSLKANGATCWCNHVSVLSQTIDTTYWPGSVGVSVSECQCRCVSVGVSVSVSQCLFSVSVCQCQCVSASVSVPVCLCLSVCSQCRCVSASVSVPVCQCLCVRASVSVSVCQCWCVVPDGTEGKEVEVEENKHISLVGEGNLKIEDLWQTHEAVYVCTASNSQGEAVTAQAQLTVLGKYSQGALYAHTGWDESGISFESNIESNIIKISNMNRIRIFSGSKFD